MIFSNAIISVLAAVTALFLTREVVKNKNHGKVHGVLSCIIIPILWGAVLFYLSTLNLGENVWHISIIIASVFVYFRYNGKAEINKLIRFYFIDIIVFATIFIMFSLIGAWEYGGMGVFFIGLPVGCLILWIYLSYNGYVFRNQYMKLALFKMNLKIYSNTNFNEYSGKSKSDITLNIKSVLKAIIGLVSFAFALVFVFYVARYSVIVDSFLIFTVILFAFLVILHYIKNKESIFKSNKLKKPLYVILGSNVLLLAIMLIIQLISSTQIFFTDILYAKLSRTIILLGALSLYLVSDEFKALLNKMRKKKQKKHTYISAVKWVSASIYRAIFTKKTVVVIQSFIIAGVFLLYFLWNNVADIISFAAGDGELLDTWNVIINYLTNSKSLAEAYQTSNIFEIIAAENGLLMMLVIWGFAVFIIGTNKVFDLMNSIPELEKTFIPRFMFVITIPAFLLILILIIVFIPSAGVTLFGSPALLVIGSLLFGGFYPKLTSTIMAVYVLAIIELTAADKKFKKININSCSKSELIELPTIGRKYADIIMNFRPIESQSQLIEKCQLSKSQMDILDGLVEF